jgi:hypothetical protein
VIQLSIIILGGLGAALIALGGPAAPWGFAAALSAQPFWIVATWRTRQWGMLAMACWYTLVWGYGALMSWGWV